MRLSTRIRSRLIACRVQVIPARWSRLMPMFLKVAVAGGPFPV
jgi:hypothetical protein